jgi:hypothetical protein
MPENMVLDGTSHLIEIEGVYINRNMGAFTVEGNYGSAPALWIEKTETALAGCWRPDPSAQ